MFKAAVLLMATRGLQENTVTFLLKYAVNVYQVFTKNVTLSVVNITPFNV